MNSISPNLNLMIKASEKASKILIRDFGEVEKLQVSLKGPNNFVTNADRKVEKIIIEELEKSKKNFSILTEETGFIKNKDKDKVFVFNDWTFASSPSIRPFDHPVYDIWLKKCYS